MQKVKLEISARILNPDRCRRVQYCVSLRLEQANLTGFKPDSRIGRRKPRAFGAAALLCLALLAFLAVVQVVHLHPLDKDADHCSLCIAMHSAAPAAVIAAVVVLVSFESSAPIVEARAVLRYWHPKLFTRPPPAGC